MSRTAAPSLKDESFPGKHLSSSSGSVALCLPRTKLPADEDLLRSEAGQGLTRAEGDVDELPGAQVLAKAGVLEGAGSALIQPLAVRGLSPPDHTVEFGGTRRQDKQRYGGSATRLLKRFRESLRRPR